MKILVDTDFIKGLIEKLENTDKELQRYIGFAYWVGHNSGEKDVEDKAWEVINHTEPDLDLF